jgi:8-oxo-dGTP pyrophosphatase MutT (NUDIX family)
LTNWDGKSRDEVSAGGVVYRQAARGVEILVCKAVSYHKWVLPKGWVDKGETLEQTARREVREETGVNARIVESLGEPEHYIYTSNGVRVFKRVHYFLMQYESGSEKDHDHEMEDVRWVTMDEALAMLAYDGAKTMVRRAQSLLNPPQDAE